MKKLSEHISTSAMTGMGPVVLPGNGTVGSGDVPAGSGDAEEEYKKKKKKRMKHLKTLESFISEGESIITEAKEAKKLHGLDAFAADEKAEGKAAEIYLATFDGTSFKAQSTDKSWDDGVPVTKNFTRGGYKSYSPKGEHYIIEGSTFWYFKIDRTWYAVKQASYGTPPFEY